MISHTTAKNIIKTHLTPLENYESVNIENAISRVNYKDITAKENILNFKRCAMDGFAIRIKDLNIAASVGLKIVDTIDAGQVSKIKIQKGECIGVATGAPLPDGADMVVMVEDTKIENYDQKNFATQNFNSQYSLYCDEKFKKIILTKINQTKSNYDEIGSDIKKGVTVVFANEVLDTARIAMLAGIGIRQIEVFRKLKVGIIATGNELVAPGKSTNYGEIYDSNSYMIYSMLSQFCEVKRYGIIPDDYDKIKEVIEKSDDDVLITIGGTSMGEKDLVFKIVENEGNMLFHNISIKPGKPTFFGEFDKKFIFGLPGNPASCFVMMHVLIIPEIRMASNLPVKIKKINLKIDREITAEKRDLFMPVKLKNNTAIPTYKHSGAISSILNAKGYIRVKAGESVKKGDVVCVNLFV